MICLQKPCFHSQSGEDGVPVARFVQRTEEHEALEREVLPVTAAPLGQDDFPPLDGHVAGTPEGCVVKVGEDHRPDWGIEKLVTRQFA